MKKKAKKPAKVVKADPSLCLRVCAANMSSSNDFVWPGVGETAVAKDFAPTKSCGQGLHAWLYGAGNHDCTSYWSVEDAKWLVVEVETASIIQLGGKVKFPRGVVKFVGDRKDATEYLLANEPRSAGVAVIGAHRSGGDKQGVVVGALGTATAGDSGEIRIRWWDEKNVRYRTVIGYVGENGIKPDVKYRLNDDHKLVEVKS